LKQSTAQNNNQNFTKSLSSQPTKKYKPHRTHQNLNRLKGMNLYKLIDWNYVLIPMNRKKESDRTKASILELGTILQHTTPSFFDLIDGMKKCIINE
jgi:hypothetical protein